MKGEPATVPEAGHVETAIANAATTTREKQQAKTSVNSISDDMSLTNLEKIIHRIEMMELEEGQREEKKRTEIETIENEYEKKKKEMETVFKMQKEEMQRKMHREKEEMENRFLKEKEELENKHRREKKETDEKCENETKLFGQRTKKEILEYEKSFINNKNEIMKRNYKIKEEHDREKTKLVERRDGFLGRMRRLLGAVGLSTAAPAPAVATAPAEDPVSSSASQKPASAPECPICLDQMTPPKKIFSCTNGHKVCGECKEKTPECFCRSAFVMRDVGFESWLRESPKMSDQAYSPYQQGPPQGQPTHSGFMTGGQTAPHQPRYPNFQPQRGPSPPQLMHRPPQPQYTQLQHQGQPGMDLYGMPANQTVYTYQLPPNAMPIMQYHLNQQQQVQAQNNGQRGPTPRQLTPGAASRNFSLK